MSSVADAPACPLRYPCKIALQHDCHGISIAEPALNIPTIFSFTLFISCNNSIWFCGILIWVLSSPSDSLISLSPKQNITMSALCASSSASFFSASSTSPSRLYPLVIPIMLSLYSLTIPATASTLVGFTIEEPAPWYLGANAKSPIIAIFFVLLRGRIDASFFNSTMLSAAAFFASLWCASLSKPPSCLCSCVLPVNLSWGRFADSLSASSIITLNSSLTLSSSFFCDSLPSFTAFTISLAEP